MKSRLLAILIPFFALPAFAQDLENDSPVSAPEATQVPPASDLNDAVDQLSKEQAPRQTARPAEAAAPAPTAAMDNGPARHASPKPFAQKSKAKPPKHKSVKVAKKAKTKKGGKAAKKKKHS